MDSLDAAFGEQAPLARELFAALGDHGNDGSHDRSHILRVWHNAVAIAAKEPGCDRAVLAAAAILHDCVAVEKNAPERAYASRLAAARARTILAGLGWDSDKLDRTAHAIEAHSYSAAIPPESQDARVLQDADRLDAIGAIGVARCFYIAGRLGSGLYEPDDPAARRRGLDDQKYALDHFAVKLFKIAANFQTKAGQALADERTRTMRDFIAALTNEIEGRTT
jgi:uncharacterized protein